MNSHRRLVNSFGALLLGALVLAIVATVSAERTAPAPAVPQSAASGFPLRFDSQGPADRPVYGASALGGTITFEGGALALSGARDADAWTISFVGATPELKAGGLRPSQGPTNALVGADASAWQRGLTAYRSMQALALLPGVDATVGGTTDRVTLHLDFAPGVDPAAATFRIDGATARLESDGTVRWSTSAGDFVLLPLAASQLVDGREESLNAAFDMTADGAIALRISTLSPDLPVGADLTVWASGLGAGSAAARGMRVALDANGDAYVSGSVPARSGAPGDGGDAFVAKLDRTGRDFAWVTYFGGDLSDVPESIAIDRTGRIAIAGAAGAHAFAAALSADGGSLLWTRDLRGSGSEQANAVAFDALGRVWIAGTTNSLDLPVTANAAQAAAGGGTDAFVATIDSDGVLAYASYFGGAQDDGAAAVQALAGGVVIAGDTRSAGLATAEALQAAPGGGSDVVVATFAADGSIVRATYVGGAGDETASGLAVDRQGRVVVAGTASGATAMPGLRSVGTGGARDAFVVALASDGSRFDLATRLGGAGDDEISALAVDTVGHILLAGRTSGGFPTFGDPGRATPRGGQDGFVATLDVDGASLLHAGLIGGSSADAASGLAVDGNGRVWLAGVTASADLDGASISNALSGGGDGFIATITDRPAPAAPTGSCPGSINFDNSAGTGLWQTATNWDTNVLPAAGDNVCINGFAVTLSSGAQSVATVHVQGAGSLTVSSGTLNISGASEVVSPATLSMAGGTIGGTGNLTVDTKIDWTSGTMSGTGATTASAGIDFGGGYATITRTVNLAGGTSTFTGAAYSITITSPGVMNIQAGATFDYQNDGAINGTGTINNAGTFQRTTSTNAGTVNAVFNNTGLVDVQSGTLALAGNGAHTGDFDATGAVLDISAGTQTFSSTSDITGTEVRFTGSSATLSGTYNVTDKTLVTGGTANLTGGTLNLIDVGNDLTVSGGTATFSSGEALTPTTFTLSGGTFGGSDSLTVSGLMTWSSGTMGGTGTTTANGGVDFGGGYQTLTRTFNNASGSTATYSGAAYSLTITTPGVFNNQAGATFDQQCDASINGTGPFNNAGTFLRTTSTNTATISAPFTNTGLVDVQAGRLNLNSSGAHTGDFDATGAILEFGSGTQTFSSTSDITGTNVIFTGAIATLSGSYTVTGSTTVTSGTVNFTGGTLNLANVGGTLDVSGGTTTFSSGEAITPTTLDFSGGTIGGSDNISVSGLFTWSSGTMGGTGTTTANGGIALGGGYQTLTRTLNNAAGSTATYSGVAYAMTITSPGVFNNQVGATFDQQCDASINGTGTFNNPGTFLRTTSTGTATVNVPFNNTNVVDVQSGKLVFNGNGAHTGDFDATGATLEIGAGTQTFSSTSDITGTDVIFSGATATLSGSYNVTGTTTISSGTVNFTGATLNLASVGSGLVVSGGTTTFSSGEAVAPTTLNFSGGTIGGSDAINISGLFTWSSGTMSGTGLTTANGGIALGGGYQTLTRTLNNTSGSTATYSGVAYAMTITAPGVFNNQAGATFDQQCDASINGTGIFNNPGTLLRTTSTGNATINSIFNNTSVVDVQSGKLILNGNGTHTGDFDSTGAILEIGAGTHTFSQTSDLTGTEVDFTGATATLSGSYDVTGITKVTSGTVNFTGGTLNLVDVGADLQVSGGTATFSSGETLTPTTVELTGGTITGSDGITIGGLFTWSSGTMSGAGVTNANGNIALGDGYQTLTRTLHNNSGSTATYSGLAYGMTITSPGVFDNQVGATFDQQCDAQISGTGLFTNAGTFLRTTSSQPATVSTIFNNTGTVDVQSGKLALNGDGTHTGDFDATGTALILGGYSTQTFSSTADVTGTEVEFQGSTVTFAGTYDVTGTTKVSYGSGNVNFTGATLNLINAGSTIQLDGGTTNFSSGETVTTTNLNMTSYAALTGSDTVIVNGPFSWDGGTMSGTGTTTLRGGIVLGTYSNTMSRTVNNANNGTVTVSGSSGGLQIDATGVFNNQAGSTFDLTNDYQIYGLGTFNNAGTFNRSTTSGQVMVQPLFNNTGTVNVTSGTLYFGGSNGSAGNFTQTSGITRMNGGVIDTYLSLNIAGGILTGTGTITGPVANTGGSIEPGQSPGTLVIADGGYTQGAGGAYTVELGGLTAGTQHDQLNVTGSFGLGTATLNGTLNATLVNGFVPSLGDAFTIVTAGTRSGTFSTRNLPPLSGGNVWNVVYTPTTVVLRVDPPTNADLAVTNADAPDPLNAGGNVTYTITVQNNGPDPATNVSLSDPLDASTTFVSATPSQGTCSQAAGTVTCPLGNLANGATATITIVATTSGTSVPSISNTATASATEADLTPGNDAATATTTVNPVANLTITKTDTPDPVQAGGTITYTIGVNNAGPNTATSVSMTDTLPAGSAFVSATGTGWTCNNVALTVTCTRGSLATGAAPDITITATAPGTPGSITNNASVTSAVFDPVTPNNASASTNVTAVADLSMTKADNPDPVDAAAQLTYTLNVVNAGPSTANAVSVTDTLPVGVTFVSAAGTGWTCNQAAGVVTCTRPTLAVAAAPSITIVVTAPSEGGSITNNASVSATEFDPAATNNNVSATTTVTPLANLSITKTDSPDPANTSSTLTYTVTVANAGPSTANTLTMTDTLPAGVTFVSAAGTGWTCNQAAGTVTCTRPTLAVATAPAISIVVTTPATPGLITNNATIAAATPVDPTPGNNTASAGTSVAVVTADMSIVKTDTPDPVNAGAALTYTINVSNAGPDPATSVTVTDPLPAGVTFVSAAGTGWTCNQAAGTVTCTRPTLAVTAAPAITISATAPTAGGSISNTATVAAAEADNAAGNNSSTATTNVTAIADLTIAKTDSPDPVQAGGALTYTINVTNAGPSAATNLSVVDVLPAGTAFVSAAGTGWTCNNAAGTVTCLLRKINFKQRRKFITFNQYSI